MPVIIIMKDTMAEVSVIIPIYNVEVYLNQCLDSLAEQNFKDAEFICVDDGSPDNCGAILKEYAEKDPRFIIITQQNKGQGTARNKGLEQAKGRYIIFADPDDYMETGAIEKIYNCFEQKKADVIQFNYKEFSENTNEIIKSNNFADFLRKKFNYELKNTQFYRWQEVFADGFKYSEFKIWTKAYSKNFLDKYEIKFPNNKNGEDDVFSAQVFLNSDKIYYLENCLYNYRLRNNSSCNSISDDKFCIFENVHRIRMLILQKGLYPRLKKSFSKYKTDVISRYYQNISKENKHKYKLCAKEILTKKEYICFLFRTSNGNSFFENLFSLKNERKNAVKYKVFTLMGLKFRISFSSGFFKKAKI